MSFRGLSKFGPQLWCLLASLLIHGLIVGGVLSLPALAQQEVTEEDVMSVAVVTPDQLQSEIDAARERKQQAVDPAPELDVTALEPRPEPTQQPPRATTEQQPPNPAAAPELPKIPDVSKAPKPPGSSQDRPDQTAQRIGPKLPSGKQVAIPRRRVLPKDKMVLAGDRQREQLCHSAAMAEIVKARPELKPDLVISSAVDATVAGDNVIVANGAAFRSEGRWFNLKFRCEADLVADTVMSFDYLIGGPFPEDQVEMRKTAAEN
uniref:DUF930 domain-containing protein n=1 Tax=Pararhizobium sp. IMCC3301 TaxID=3067904 RepID=UPI002741A72D|nr:DUF930 domain-containing protein [Pararhizobium sp. IMCC3301]